MLWAFIMPLPYYAHFVPKEQRQPLSDILSYKNIYFITLYLNYLM